MIISGVISLGICYAVVFGFNLISADGRVFITLKIMAVSFACLASYIGMNLILGMEYCEILTDRLKGKVFAYVKK